MRFSKWHALGNSYLVVERSERGQLRPAEVVALCDPDTGIGSDGVLEVTSVEPARVEIAIWNPDGSQAELSGNGTRIAARWLSGRFGGDEVVVAVGARRVKARLRGGLTVEQDLGPIKVGAAETIDLEGMAVEFVPVDVGNPHAVVERAPERDALLRLGPLIERHARFPGRTNVQLLRIDGRNEITVLVWERGAGETRASGTSACAAAAAAISSGHCESPVTVHLPGGDL
jgi:diaminopimelate epimerase